MTATKKEVVILTGAGQIGMVITRRNHRHNGNIAGNARLNKKWRD